MYVEWGGIVGIYPSGTKRHEKHENDHCRLQKYTTYVFLFSGLIDCHAHVYEHATVLGVNPDKTCLARGIAP